MTSRLKTWVKDSLSPYQLSDLTRFPDWHNLIVWDAYFNNLTSGLMIISCLAWLCGAAVYGLLLPFAMTLAFILLAADLIILVADLGDSMRFFHSLRVMRFTSPLSVGVWGLSCYGFFLAAAVIFSWWSISYGSAESIGFYFLSALSRLFTIMALVAAIVVICYKGVVFSCSSQPGVKDARWLTSFMVSDSLLMGLSLYILLVLSILPAEKAIPFILPFIILVTARCIAFGLLWQDVKTRAHKIYKIENTLLGWSVIGVCGILVIPLIFCGIFGLSLSCLLCLGCGFLERHWITGLAKPVEKHFNS